MRASLPHLGTIGAVVADILLSQVVVVLGWRQAVYLTVHIGLGLTVLLFLLIRDKPSWIAQVPRSYFSWKHNTWGRLLELLKNWRFWMAGFVGCFLFLSISVLASLWDVNFMIQAYYLPPAEGVTAVTLLFIGSALGSPFSGGLSGRIQNRRVPLFIGISSTFVLALILIYVPGLPLSEALSLLFLIEFCVGPEALIFAIAREIRPPRSTGISTAATNFILTIGAAIFQPIIRVIYSSFIGQALKRWQQERHFIQFKTISSCFLFYRRCYSSPFL
ncbi:MFS transporter [Coxiella endosymbiont of Ornithodoros maritimus]